MVGCRVGIELPTVEVRYENLTIQANCYVGNRGLPTLANVVRDIVEVTTAPRSAVHIFGMECNGPISNPCSQVTLCFYEFFQGFLDTIHLLRSKKKVLTILDNVSGSLKPGRYTI